ncbi:hypothetical protein Poli38472_004917 [Pythium oligandrum]|uniref:Uncharacterized protein n=1 Tax=Pythium oligandrum TaxID=41045 RepID=A0A8K1FIK6_PYTOL|nr:hypothetical protein Poli38472_004917 [Pythium oligandrum]|eukprot:TMW59848.1 hypothetical protein Poli38472_004917 [Pythium oligandrum]
MMASTMAYGASSTNAEAVEKKPWRNRAKEEVKELQHTVKQLKATLKRLRERNKREKRVVHPSRVWEDVSQRQKRQRCRAEEENAKLRSEIIARAFLLQQMTQLVRQTGDSYLTFPTALYPRVPRPLLYTRSVEGYLARISELYYETESAFASHMTVDQIDTFREVSVAEEDKNTTLVTQKVCWTVPFTVERVVEALWQSMLLKPAPRGCGFDYNPALEASVLVASCCKSVIGPDSPKSVDVLSNLVIKKFPQSDRNGALMVAHMSAGLAESSSHLLKDGVGWDDYWLRVRECPREPHEESTSPLSQIQVFRRTRLKLVKNRTAAQRRFAGALTALIIDHVEEELEWRQQAIEHFLLASGHSH